MSRKDLSTQDRKDIDKFIKYLVYKFVQIVVQSRQGVRLVSQSKKLSSSSDWFNLAIRDQLEILDATKNAYSNRPVDLSQPLCVEVSLRTSEKETMTLEYWCLQLSEKVSLPDSSFKVPLNIYNCIGVLLKSVVLVSRSTPVYHLSRRQSSDNYCICCNICFREPVFFSSGEEFQRQCVGSVPTLIGTITASVVYRTKLSVCPKLSATDLTSTIKDDHFNKPLLFQTKHGKHAGAAVALTADPSDVRRLEDGTANVAAREGNVMETSGQPLKRAAFGSNTIGQLIDDEPTDLPFATLLHYASPQPEPQSPSVEQSDDDANTTIQHSSRDLAESHGMVPSMTTTKEDFVLVELKAPFVGREEDLGRFYRDCQMAPALSMFEQTGNMHDMLNSITDQLAQFEASANEFNEFVNSLQDFE